MAFIFFSTSILTSLPLQFHITYLSGERQFPQQSEPGLCIWPMQSRAKDPWTSPVSVWGRAKATDGFTAWTGYVSHCLKWNIKLFFSDGNTVVVLVLLREKILLPDSSQAPHPTSEAAVKLTNFREQPLLCPSKTSAVEVNSALQEATRYNIKIKYSGLSAMQLQIMSMINTVIMSKDGHNFSLTWGGQRGR